MYSYLYYSGCLGQTEKLLVTMTVVVSLMYITKHQIYSERQKSYVPGTSDTQSVVAGYTHHGVGRAVFLKDIREALREVKGKSQRQGRIARLQHKYWLAITVILYTTDL